MTRLERYREKLKRFEHQRNQLMIAGRYRESHALNQDIEELRKAIEEAEAYEESCKPKPIGQLVSKAELDEMGIIPLMIECHLIADFLTGVAMEVRDICKAHGMTGISLMPSLQKIIKESECFAESFMSISKKYEQLVANNDTLNMALHKKILSYIKQRLK